MLCELVPEDIREPYDPYSDPYYNQQPNYNQPPQQQPNNYPQNYGQPNPVYNDDGYPTYPGARGRRGFNY